LHSCLPSQKIILMEEGFWHVHTCYPHHLKRNSHRGRILNWAPSSKKIILTEEGFWHIGIFTHIYFLQCATVTLDIEGGTGCRKAWLDTMEALVYDDGEGSTYGIGTQTAMFSWGRTLRPIGLKGHGAIVDFQTGGPTVSPLLLIYMWLEIKCDLWKGQFHPASSPSLMSAHHSLSIWSYPLWMCRLGLCQSTTSCTELTVCLSGHTHCGCVD